MIAREMELGEEVVRKEARQGVVAMVSEVVQRRRCRQTRR